MVLFAVISTPSTIRIFLFCLYGLHVFWHDWSVIEWSSNILCFCAFWAGNMHSFRCHSRQLRHQSPSGDVYFDESASLFTRLFSSGRPLRARNSLSLHHHPCNVIISIMPLQLAWFTRLDVAPALRWRGETWGCLLSKRLFLPAASNGEGRWEEAFWN